MPTPVSMPARTVLVIDDDENIRFAVRMVLEGAGYAVLEAANGLEGLELLRAGDRPLVVLLDLMMPQMSGLELLRAVAAEPDIAARYAFILFSIADAFSASRLRMYRLRVRLLDLPKPFDMGHLLAVVGEAARHLGHLEWERDDGRAP